MKDALAPLKRGIAITGSLIAIIAAIGTVVSLPLDPILRVIIGSIVVLPAAFIIGLETGRRQRQPAPEDSQSVVVRTYPKSQSPEFYADAQQLARTASNITLIGINPHLIWQRDILDLLIDRAQAGSARITVCMANTRSPHVLGRLIEEEMNPNRPLTGLASIDHSVQALVARLEFLGNPVAFEVRLFEHYPTLAMAIFDDRFFVYPYAYQVIGNESPLLQMRDNGSREVEFFKDHARRVLRDSVAACDVVKAKHDPGFYSSKWRCAAVGLIPAAETDLYRTGSSVLGFDIWAQREVPMPRGKTSMRPYVGEAAYYGFHVTLADGLYFCNDAEIERVKAELLMLSQQFPPVRFTSLDLVDGFQDPNTAVLRVSEESGTLEAIHHELVARVYITAISSMFKAGKTLKQVPPDDARARLMVQRYGAPYIIKAFSPHFTLCSAMPSDENRRARIMQQLEATMKPVLDETWEIAEIVLLTRGAEEERWKVLQRFRLRG